MYRFALVSMSLLAAASPASAITCRGDFQVVGGHEISTPYCRDRVLGAVAREHGMKITDAEIRNYPGRKDEVCRYVGDDIRARPACDEVDTDHDWR